MHKVVKPYRDVCDHYSQLRQSALEEAHKELPEVLVFGKKAILKKEITLSQIDYITYEKLSSWQYLNTRIVGWDWKRVRHKYRTHPNRFELAIWHHDKILAGASIGTPTRGGGKLRLDFIEANPKGSIIRDNHRYRLDLRCNLRRSNWRHSNQNNKPDQRKGKITLFEQARIRLQ